MKILFSYLLLINLAAFFLYGLDKYKARKGKWRISEAALLTVALLGGSLGALLGMRTFHHKTRHRRFAWGIPAVLLVQVLVLLYVCVL
ncbi:MAG TPA: DUF1294 domain-containing protein [Candidatus Blautia gallistercoris]|mgnify:CR=1 FL=1|uniref:DUF1294 domain-containing protein n=1 Tax=Candidatus Blautia gallistercoris TaxID=2838490 RepID=A0A9D1WIV2_9FIRM|nr:DUF1294 domain-containing protein [Candidatus Blautia gallistercoris]